jgi:hypothetical protein
MTDYLVKQQNKVFDSLRQAAKVKLKSEAFLRYINVEKQYRAESPENAYDALFGWLWDEVEAQSMKIWDEFAAQSLKEYPLEGK